MLRRIRSALRRGEKQFPALPEVGLTPIGYVRNRVKRPTPDGWAAVESQIVLRPELAPALLNLDQYSHIIVVFWPHEVPGDVRGSRLQLHPRDDTRYPLMGVLATRSQIRPNPLLTSVVPLLSVKEATLRVRGLDAIDGTPVLDIKPYLPFADSVPDASVPGWVEQAQAWRRKK